MCAALIFCLSGCSLAAFQETIVSTMLMLKLLKWLTDFTHNPFITEFISPFQVWKIYHCQIRCIYRDALKKKQDKWICDTIAFWGRSNARLRLTFWNFFSASIIFLYMSYNYLIVTIVHVCIMIRIIISHNWFSSHQQTQPRA